jgi:hypothetical protein
LYNKPRCHVLLNAFFNIQEYSSRRHDIIEIQVYVVRKPHTLKCRAVMGTETKLACIKKAAFSMVLWTIFRVTFSNNLPNDDKKLIGSKFCGQFGSLPGIGYVIRFATFQGFGKWDSRRQ